MTQEMLADLLGLSTEAISKYERSQSFIRGDYEHRLVERLGWSADALAECRLDWDMHHLRPPRTGYRVLHGVDAIGPLGATFEEINRKLFELLDAAIGSLPDGFSAPNERWVDVCARFPENYAFAVGADGSPVAYWAVYFWGDVDRARFRARMFQEVDLRFEDLRRAVMPGRYFGYCPAAVILPGHEAVAPAMVTSFVTFLETLAGRGVLLEGIGATSVSADGRQFCQDLGFRLIGAHELVPCFGVWELSGAAIAGSVFGRRSVALRHAYRAVYDGA